VSQTEGTKAEPSSRSTKQLLSYRCMLGTYVYGHLWVTACCFARLQAHHNHCAEGSASCAQAVDKSYQSSTLLYREDWQRC
jgi:hypothetical protein